MGQRGPAPQPAALRRLRGETRPSRLRRSPPSTTDPPSMLTGLPPAVSDVWDASLAVTSHIGREHAPTLRLYCEAVATLEAMQPKGTRKYRHLLDVFRRLARELCFTPATKRA